jgi:hypothetical protein
MHIGSLELYRMHAWMGERVMYVHFIPMSLGQIRPLVEQGCADRWQPTDLQAGKGPAVAERDFSGCVPSV